MDGRPYQHAFALRFRGPRALVLFRSLEQEIEAVEPVAAELATIIAEELRLPRVDPEQWAEPRIAPIDAKMPSIRLADLKARRTRFVRQVLLADDDDGRCPVGLIHPFGFWVMFPCDTLDAAERLVDRLSPG